jgi:tetratricopeptide (TPR) repeat protein
MLLTAQTILTPRACYAHLPRVILVDLYTTWASRTKNPAFKLELAKKANAACDAALAFDPHNASIWHQSAYIDLTFLNQESTALAKYEKAVELDPDRESLHALFGNYFMAKARAEQDNTQRERLARRAIQFHLKAADVAKEPLVYYNLAAQLGTDIGEAGLLMVCFKEKQREAPPRASWHAEESLVYVYCALHNKPAALEAIDHVLQRAPKAIRPRLLQLQARIQQQP